MASISSFFVSNSFPAKELFIVQNRPKLYISRFEECGRWDRIMRPECLKFSLTVFVEWYYALS